MVSNTDLSDPLLALGSDDDGHDDNRDVTHCDDTLDTGNRSIVTALAEVYISGMTCSVCSSAIETALRNNLPNLVSVNISITTDTAEVEWEDKSTVTSSEVMENIRQIIDDVGYGVEEMRLVKKALQPNRKDDYRNQINSNSFPSAYGDSPNGTSNLDHTRQEEEEEEETAEQRWQRYRSRQLRKLQQRRQAFLVSLVGTLPILILTMVLPYILDTDALFHHRHITLFHKYKLALKSVVLWALATPVQFFCGFDFYKMAWYGIRSGRAGMDVLVALGTTASYSYAVVGVLWEDEHASHFFETSAVLICFVLAGKWMQAIAVHRTSDALSHLMELQSKTAIKVTPLKDRQSFDPVKDPYVEETVDIQRIKVNDMVKVIRGASIPADGRVLFGDILVNESMVTGESMPVLKTPGSVVLGGTVCVETSISRLSADDNSSTSSSDDSDIENRSNQIGAAFIEVTGIGSNTALAQIVKMVQMAQSRSVPIQSYADSISAVFVPTVCAISLLTYLVWYALCSSEVVPKSWYEDDGEDAATFSLMFAIACLVISCPCALGLATPTAVMVGTGVGASKCGVLMKGGQALEIASQVDAVVLDKTGTLTKGTPTVSDFVRINDSSSPFMKRAKERKDSDGGSPETEARKYDIIKMKDRYVLWLLASLERTSEHPLAKAVVTYAEERLGQEELISNPLAHPLHFRAVTGRGCRGSFMVEMYIKQESDTVKTTEVTVGNRSYARSMGLSIPSVANDCMKIFEQQGKTAIFVSVDGSVFVVLGIADELKPDAKASVYYLREKLNVDVWMVTGDNSRTAAAVAQQLDIPTNRVISEALPAAKLAIVKKLQEEGRVVAMVGKFLTLRIFILYLFAEKSY